MSSLHANLDRPMHDVMPVASRPHYGGKREWKSYEVDDFGRPILASPFETGLYTVARYAVAIALVAVSLLIGALLIQCAAHFGNGNDTSTPIVPQAVISEDAS